MTAILAVGSGALLGVMVMALILMVSVKCYRRNDSLSLAVSATMLATLALVGLAYAGHQYRSWRLWTDARITALEQQNATQNNHATATTPK